jgi:soluble lytic murein transglycosylase-like protein
MLGHRTLRGLAAPLLIGAVVTASVPGVISIRVHRGDTLSAIARQHHTTVSMLVALNHLPGHGDLIYAGQLLTVPGGTAGRRGAAHGASTATYTVRAGDTLSAVAAARHTSLAWLRQHNRLDRRSVIYIGQRLAVPAPARPARRSSANTFAGRTYSPGVVASAARHRAALAARRAPSRSSVRALIRSTARRYGVDPALALAVAHQESGFQQRVVSPADAIGAMQVLPATAQFVSKYVAHRRLDPLRAADNVTAGVGLLKVLTRAAPVDKAVAGYYQGLGSVQRNGMYADTKTYVAGILALRKHYAATRH